MMLDLPRMLKQKGAPALILFFRMQTVQGGDHIIEAIRWMGEGRLARDVGVLQQIFKAIVTHLI